MPDRGYHDPKNIYNVNVHPPGSRHGPVSSLPAAASSPQRAPTFQVDWLCGGGETCRDCHPAR